MQAPLVGNEVAPAGGSLRIVVTGVTVGNLGLEGCRQLALSPEVTKLIITSRSEEKAKAAIAELVKVTGKDASMFASLVVDWEDLASIKAAAAAMPDFDRLLLNAGGLAGLKKHLSGATHGQVINTLGHTVLVEDLLANGKLKEGAGQRVIYVGSEVSRDVISFTGLLPNYFGYFAEKDLESAISENYSTCPAIRTQLGDYKNAKIVGHMHFVNYAKEKPGIHWSTVSPGAVGASFAGVAFFPVKQLMATCPGIFYVMCVTHACGAEEAQQIGAKRYVDVLTGEPKFPNGSMPMSPHDCCGLCFWGAKGKMVDNRPLVPYFRDESLHAATAVKVREYAAKWAAATPAGGAPTSSETMQR